MECAYCGDTFNGYDEVVIEKSGLLFHEENCFYNYMLENRTEKTINYLEYLESKLLLLTKEKESALDDKNTKERIGNKNS